MSERDELKARAAKHKLEYANNISTANLRKLVEKADAEALSSNGNDQSDSTSDQGNSNEPPTNGGGQSNGASDEGSASDEGGATNTPSGDEDQGQDAAQNGVVLDGAQPVEMNGVRINCAIANGRRRAGRKWPGGVSDVLVADLDDGDLEALHADPMFSVTPIMIETDE